MDDQQKRVRVHEQQRRDGADGNGGYVRGGRGGHGGHGEPEPVPREEGRNAVDAEHGRGGQGVRTGLCIGVRERDHGERERRGWAELPLRVRQRAFFVTKKVRPARRAFLRFLLQNLLHLSTCFLVTFVVNYT